MIKKTLQFLFLTLLAGLVLCSCNNSKKSLLSSSSSEKAEEVIKNEESLEDTLEKDLSSLQNASDEGSVQLEEEVILQKEEDTEEDISLFPQSDPFAALEDEGLLSLSEDEETAYNDEEQEEVSSNQEKE